GYGVAVNETTAYALRTATSATPATPATPGQITLFIHTHVREDALELFGFATPEGKHLFETLLTVSGVGPKTALVITSATTNEIRKAVEEGNVSFFVAFSRVGKKLAQKIIIELKSKLGSLEDLDLSESNGQGVEVRQALETLGYADHEIRKALREVNIESLSLQEAIKACIRILSKK
ncbi:MAG: Holliday junction branch migration protein RuvA, partial [Patescibacteria group bacterium]